MRDPPPGLWVALGGGLGAAARFLLSGWIAWPGFPWATFIVNVTGSALLGFLYRALPAPAAPARVRAFLAIGLCGGFTTFGTFEAETLGLLQRAHYATATVYSLGSAVACVLGVFAGMSVATLVKDPPPMSMHGRNRE